VQNRLLARVTALALHASVLQQALAEFADDFFQALHLRLLLLDLVRYLLPDPRNPKKDRGLHRFQPLGDGLPLQVIGPLEVNSHVGLLLF